MKYTNETDEHSEVQLNKEAKDEMLLLMKKHKRAYCILIFLIFHMDQKNTIMIKQKVIQEALGISKNTVIGGVKILKQYNFIGVYKTGNANIYTINANIARTNNERKRIK